MGLIFGVYEYGLFELELGICYKSLNILGLVLVYWVSIFYYDCLVL